MKLVHLMKLVARVTPPVSLGKVITGNRMIYGMESGEFEGDRLRGKILPGGGEWFVQNEEGMGQPDVRLLLETDDGAPIYVRYSGVLEFNEKVMDAIGQGRSTAFGDNRFLTHVRFEAGDPRYAWLTHTVAVGEGRMHPDSVEYAIYELAHA